jgi:hypothetical protein
MICDSQPPAELTHFINKSGCTMGDDRHERVSGLLINGWRVELADQKPSLWIFSGSSHFECMSADDSYKDNFNKMMLKVLVLASVHHVSSSGR